MSKVTRSRSWGAKPAGVVVYNRHKQHLCPDHSQYFHFDRIFNRHGEPAGLEGYSTPAPQSTVGLGYRPPTAMSAKSGRSNTGGRG